MTDQISRKPQNSLGEGPHKSHSIATEGGVSSRDVEAGVSEAVIRKSGEKSELMDQLLVNRGKTFWTFQAAGWTGYLLVRISNSVVSQQNDSGYILYFLVATITGVILTSIVRYLYRRIRDWSMPRALLSAVLVCVSMGMVISTVELSALPFLVEGLQPFQALERLSNAGFEAMVMLAWTAIYFGYHYYESFQEEKERALKATAQAHQAQLKMLRYQLNPHFLFNTLNAISTLVLEDARSEANSMLTKLSSFLRYTLVNQPSQKVSIDQELYTLGLYLEIEKIRFQDRLNVTYEIDDSVRDALLPSLILQPLIENSIKYAIAPAENGGEICIHAEPIAGNKVRVSLKDTGPGITDIENIKSQTGSGVGIANTKERLEQLYGPNHRVAIENLKPQGLGIIMEMPIERTEKKKPVARLRPLIGDDE